MAFSSEPAALPANISVLFGASVKEGANGVQTIVWYMMQDQMHLSLARCMLLGKANKLCVRISQGRVSEDVDVFGVKEC